MNNLIIESHSKTMHFLYTIVNFATRMSCETHVLVDMSATLNVCSYFSLQL